MAAIVSIIVAIILAITAGMAHLPVVRKYALQWGQERLAAQQGLKLEADDLSYNLFTLKSSLKNVRLQSTDAPDLPPFFEAERVELDLSLLSLARGELEIESGTLEGARIQVVFADDGGSNLPPSRGEGDGEPPSISIRSFVASGPLLSYEDRGPPLAAEIRQWRLRINGSDGAHRIRLTSGAPGLLRYEERQAPLAGLRLDLGGSAEDATIREAQVRIGETELRAEGGVGNPFAPDLSVRARVRGAVADMAQLAGVEAPLDGRLRLDADIAGPVDALTVSARLRGDDLEHDGLPRANASAEVQLALGDDRVELSSLSLEAPWAQANGSGSIALAEEAGSSTLSVDYSRVDLALLSRYAESDVQAAARASGSVRASFPGLEFAQADVEGDVRLNAARQEPAPNVLPVSGRASFRRQGERIQANLRGLQTLGATLSGPAVIGPNGGLSGSLDLTAPELGETIRMLDLYLGSAEGESAAPTAVEGPLSATIALSGTADAPAARIQASGDGWKVGDLEGVGLALTASASRERVEVESLVVDWAEQRFEASGTAALGEESTAISFTASTTDARIADLLHGLGDETPAEGLLSFQANVAGTVESPEIEVTASARSLVAYSEPLGALDVDASYVDDRLEVSRLRLTKPEGRGGIGAVEGGGFVDFATNRMSFKLGGEDLQVSGLELPSGETLAGIFSLSASGEGTVSEPRVAARIDAQELRLDDLELGALGATASLDGAEARLEASAAKWNTSLQVQTSLEGARETAATIVIDGLDVALLEVPVRRGENLTGQVSGRIKADGEWGAWERFDVETLLSELSLNAAGETVALDGEARASFENRTLSVDRLALLSGESRLEVSGALPLDQPSQGQELRVSGGIDLSPIPALLGVAEEEGYADGVLQLSGVVSGTLEAPEPQLDLTLENAELSLPQTLQPVTAVHLDAALDPSAVEVRRLEAQWAQATIEGRGTAATAFFLDDAAADEAPRTEFQLSLSGLDLGALKPLPRETSGRVSVVLEARAAKPSIESLEGSIRFDELSAAYGDLRLTQQGSAELRLENGVVRATNFELTGPRTSLRLTGSAGLTGERPLDLNLEAEGDAGIATLLVEDVVAAGRYELAAAVGGTLDDPSIDGRFEISDGRAAFDDPRLDATSLDVALRFDGQRVEIERWTGELNGGAMRAEGGFAYANGGIRDLNVKFDADNLFLDFPEGFRTLSRASITASSEADDLILIGGRVAIEDGSMRERIDLDSRALDALGGAGVELAEEPSPFLSRIRYDVAVDTENPILVDNNLARLEADIDLRLAGTYYRPALLGRVVFAEGGEVYLAENDYVIESGSIDFVSETRIQPSLNLTARTQIGGHEITLRAQGDAEDMDTEFTSDTGLPEPDIISLLLTGRTLEDAQESGFNIAQEQALSYLTGRLGGRISRAAEDSLGLSRVRIEPNLIAAEDDPSARLTIGQNLTRALELIYSMNLTDSGDQIFVAEYDVTRMFVTRGVKQADNSYRFDFRHGVRFGLGEGRLGGDVERAKETVGEVRFVGDLRLDESELRDVFGIEAGDRYDFFKTRNRLDRLSRHYHRELNRLEARLRLRRDKRPGEVDLEIEIEAGPKTNLVYEGADPPGGVRKDVEEAWIRGVFEEQRIADAKDVLTAWLSSERRYRSEVAVQVDALADDQQRVLFDVYQGPQFDSLTFDFRGAEAMDPEQLELILDRTELRGKPRAEARAIANVLQRYYRQEGYLAAEVDPPALELNDETGEAIAAVAVREGPLFRIGELSYEGATAVSEDELRKATSPPADTAYTPRFLEQSIENVEELYWARGYNDVTVGFSLYRDEQNARVDVRFVIDEDEQDLVREIAVEGNRHVGEELIRKRMANKVGEPLVSENNDRSRRRLYDTGAFALVDFEADELEQPAAAAGLNPVKLTARIREVSPYKLRYGAFFDTERGPGLIADFENRNTLGSARVTGFRTRYDDDFREARAYFGQPLLRGLPINSSATVFRSREFRRSTLGDESQQVFITDRTGFTLQQEITFDRKWILNYGYRYERAHVFDQDPDPFFPFDITVNVAPLLATLSYDTRDELLDATRGQFFSNGVEYAPGGLGSSVPLAKYFGQYFRYESFFRPESTAFDRKPRRPRLTWASGVRVGVADGLGETEVIPFSERFFAGGGTTIRGFVQDGVGPIDFDGAPLGGEAVFLLNQEARFPVIGLFEGVGFVDVGNVYEKIEDFDLGSLRSSAGLGLRVRTPFFLLRADYGFKLDRKPGESRGEFFFSIGQAF